MRILFCVNWAVDFLSQPDSNRFSPEYAVSGRPYWFFGHLPNPISVDVLDCRAPLNLHVMERNILKCFPFQSLMALLRERRYDAVLSHGAQSAFVLALLNTILGRTTPHFLFDVGAINGGRSSPLAVRSCAYAFRSLSGLIYHASGQAAHYQQNFPALYARSRFIPLGVDVNEFAPQDVPVEDQIICVGYAKRDWRLLLQAYAALRTRTRLVLLGMPRQDGQLPDGAIAIPRVNIAEMRRWIARSRFVVLPLPDTPYSVGQQTLLQSMSLGKAVVVSDVPAVTDYVADGSTAMLYRCGDADELKRKIEVLLADPAETEAVGWRARLRVVREFSESLMARRVLEFLQETS